MSILNRVAIVPSSFTISSSVGVQGLQAIAYDTNNQVMTGSVFSWSTASGSARDTTVQSTGPDTATVTAGIVKGTQYILASTGSKQNISIGTIV